MNNKISDMNRTTEIRKKSCNSCLLYITSGSLQKSDWTISICIRIIWLFTSLSSLNVNSGRLSQCDLSFAAGFDRKNNTMLSLTLPVAIGGKKRTSIFIRRKKVYVKKSIQGSMKCYVSLPTLRHHSRWFLRLVLSARYSSYTSLMYRLLNISTWSCFWSSKECGFVLLRTPSEDIMIITFTRQTKDYCFYQRNQLLWPPYWQQLVFHPSGSLTFLVKGG